MNLETGHWKLGIALLALLAAGGMPCLAGATYVERMTEIETCDTIPAEGEVVAVVDDGDVAVQLRYGDGKTAGGLIVADPYSIKSAYYRALTRGEYSVIMGGVTTASNAIYRLLQDREDVESNDAANTGTLTIRPRADVLLSGISYVMNEFNGRLQTAVTPAWKLGATNVVLTATEGDVGVYPTPTDVRLWITNLTVYGWVGDHLIGTTNDVRGTVLLVRDARHDDEPVNLGKHNRLLANHRGEDWSLYPATQTVDMSWQDVELSPYCKLTGTARGADIAVMTAGGDMVTNAISIDYMGQACTIVGYSLGATNVTLVVEASITMTNAPVIQWTTNTMPDASWADAATATDWPTQTWYTAKSGKRFPAWTLTANRTQGVDEEYFRVLGYPAAATNSVTIHLPLVPAAGITLNGTNITSWAALKALLDGMP